MSVVKRQAEAEDARKRSEALTVRFKAFLRAFRHENPHLARAARNICRIHKPKEFIMGILERLLAVSKRPAEAPIGEPPRDAARYPELVEVMMAERGPDGKKRDRASILLVIEDGAWKAGLLLRSEGLSLWRTGDSPLDAIEAIQRELQSESPAFRRLGKG